MKRVFQVLIALAICLALSGTAYAGQGKMGGSKGKQKAGDTSDRTKGKQKREFDAKDKDKSAKKEGKEHAKNEAGPDDRPHGWDQGGKKGWGDCDVPPGLAKKRGCNDSGYSTRERAELRRQAEVRKRASTTTTKKTTTTTTTTTEKKKSGGFLGAVKDQQEKARTSKSTTDSKVKPVQE